MRFYLPWFAASFLLSSADAQTTPGRIVLATTTILDGKGGIQRNQQIAIEGSIIQSIEPMRGAATYDLRGLTVMPGWIDAHVHLNWHFDSSHKLVNHGDTPQNEALYTAENAWITLQGGFTTVQSVGAMIDGPVRDRINQGLLPGPRILTSLRQITDQSGSPDQLRALVRQIKEEGADVIKLFATKGMGAGGAQSMTDEQIQATCGEAKAVGLRAVVHAISSVRRQGLRASWLYIDRARELPRRRYLVPHGAARDIFRSEFSGAP